MADWAGSGDNMDPDYHQKLRRNRARHLGLVRLGTDRQTDYYYYAAADPPDRPGPIASPPLPGPPLLTPGGRVRPRMGGRIPPKPPLLAQGGPGTPYNGGGNPPKPPKTLFLREWPFSIPQSPRPSGSGTEKVWF